MRRLLAESGLDGSGIPPTGPKRTLTKGDVLAAMGLCAPPRGSNDLVDGFEKTAESVELAFTG